MENAVVRVPSLAEMEVVKLINGPEAFTPDGEFILGPSDVRGFWVAAGFCEHGLVAGGYKAIDSLRLEKGYRSGERISRPRTRASRRGSALRSHSTTATSSVGMRSSVPTGRRSGCSVVSRSRTQGRLRSAPSQCASMVSWSAGSRAAGTVTPSSIRSRMPTFPPSTTWGTEVAVEIFGEWVAGEISAEPLFDPRGERIRS